MKLILLTPPDFFVEEDKILTALFEEGLTSFIYGNRTRSRFIRNACSHYCRKVIIIKLSYTTFLSERRIQLTRHTPERKESGASGRLQRTYQQIFPSYRRVESGKENFNYVFLSPIFDSISKSNYTSAFDMEVLKQASAHGIIDKRVMALGGITTENMAVAKDFGFGGVVVLGDLWNRFNIHSTLDNK